MDWSMKPVTRWDWENMMVCNGRVNESTKSSQAMNWSIGSSNNDSVQSSASEDCSLYDWPNCSSRSYISNSFDSLTNLEMRRSRIDLEKNNESFLKESTKRKELDNVEKTGSFESLIGLKLGKRTYFQDLSASNNLKSSSNSLNTSTLIKKSRLSCLSMQTPQCQVEECTADLSEVKEYYRRHRVCENHSKSQNVIVGGQGQRFCQQCSRFHELSEFDDKKRSCRRRLSDHNARRRKPQPNIGHQMNFVSNPVSPVPSYALSNFRRKGTGSFKLSQDTGAFLMCIKEGFIDDRSCAQSLDATNSISTPHFDRHCPLKGTTDLETMPCTSIPDGTPELHRALSLLSTDIWCSNPTSLHKLPAFSDLPAPPTQEAHSGFPLTSSGFWHPEHHIKSEPVFEFQQRHQGRHHPHNQDYDYNG